jgi:serine/threonine protein kinase
VDRTTPISRPSVGFDAASAGTDDARVRLENALGSRYRIQHRLGRGQFSTVYHAVGIEIPGAVALKLLDLDASVNTELAERLENDVRISASVAVDGVLAPLGIERHDSSVILVMPLMRAGNLAALLHSRGPLPLDEVQKLVLVLASTLDRLHKRNITHRGLTPENILYDSAGRPCISDVGVTDTLLNAKGTHGTRASRAAAYAAPEQRRLKRVDGRADQYALAVIAYELLTGERRVDDDLHVGIHTVPPIEVHAHAALRKDVPLYVNAALRQALSANAANRFATASQFAEAFAGVGPDRARGLPTTRIRLVLKRRHRIAGIVAAVFAVFAIATVVDPTLRFHVRNAWNAVARRTSLPEVKLGLPSDPLSSSSARGAGGSSATPSAGANNVGTASPSSPALRTAESRNPASGSGTIQPLTLGPADPGNGTPAIIHLRSTIPNGSRLPDVPDGAKAVSEGRATLRDSWSWVTRTFTGWLGGSASQSTNIQVSTDRGSALVTIDGIPRGLAPLTVSVSPGHHTVAVSGSVAYEAATRDVNSQSGETLSLSFHGLTKP